jgi:hypothetical protein
MWAEKSAGKLVSEDEASGSVHASENGKIRE